MRYVIRSFCCCYCCSDWFWERVLIVLDRLHLRIGERKEFSALVRNLFPSSRSCLQLMCKLRDQYSINDRLREYIERMLTVIIEHNPQLLEVTTSAGLSIGSMSVSSMNTRRQVYSTQTEPTSVPSESLTSTDPSLTSSTSKGQADKNCRL